MIIELVGLPGSGKTTLAKSLAERGAVVVAAPKGFRLLFESFRYFLRNPVRFLRLKLKTLQVTPKGLAYTLLVNLVLVHAAKQEIALRWARKGRTAIIDQGFFQNLLAAFAVAPTDEVLEAYARLLPKPDLLVVVSVSPEEREQQLAERGSRPRAEFGEEAVVRLEAVATQAAARLEPLLTKLQLPYQIGSASALADIALPEGPYRAPAFHQFLKHLSYGILYTLRVFVSWREERVVLMYHAIEHSSWRLAVSPPRFERQMAYLASRKLAAPLSDVVAGTAPKHAVAVTFDDGYQDLLETVLPIIERYHVPVTVFVPSDLSTKTDRDGRVRLSEEELKALATSPLVSIESHAKTHRKLTELPAEEVGREAEESKEELGRMLGVAPIYFAYPYGARNESVERVIESARYDAAFGITDGLVTKQSPRFALPRVQVDATMTPFLFKARLTRAVLWNRRLFRRT